jgi:hypothetical protein
VVISPGTTNGRDQGAVALDGSQVLFSTRAGQTGDVVCDSAANKLRVMRKADTPAGAAVSQVSASECVRVAPVCDGTDGDDLFQGASVDQTKVYFLSSRQLADSDLDGGFFSGCQAFVTAGCDLYLYDSSRPAGQRLTQVSAGDETNPTPGAGAQVRPGVAAISGDGSHVYFVASGVLTTDPSPTGATAAAGQPNLYVYQRDQEHPDGRIAFVGAASEADAGSLWDAAGTFKDDTYPVPATGRNEAGSEVGGDGHRLVFVSKAPFTSDDGDGGYRDLFRYDADVHELVRVSKAAPGGVDGQPVDAFTFQTGTDVDSYGTAFAEFKRWASEDGQTIVIRTQEGLTADDDNGIVDDYIWRDGEAYRLPGTSRPAGPGTSTSRPTMPALSHDGSSIAFQSYDRLLPADGDTVLDVYVVRVDGGFPVLAGPDECQVLEGGCQDGGAATVGSQSHTGSAGTGDFAPAARGRLAFLGMSSAVLRRASRTGVLAVRVRTSSAGPVSLTARARLAGKARRVGVATTQAPSAGTVVLRLRLSPRVGRRLAAGQMVRLEVIARHPGARSRARSVLMRPEARS